MEKTRRPRDHLVNQDTKPVKKREENRRLTMWGYPRQSISLFLEGRKRNKKIPKASFNLLKLALGIFEWIRNNSECHDLKIFAGIHINLLDAGPLFLPFHSDVLKACICFLQTGEMGEVVLHRC